MLDKLNFMETLRSVVELTKTSNKPLPREEIESYFEGMELTEEQHQMIYEYLLNPQTEEVVEETETEEASLDESIDEDNEQQSHEIGEEQAQISTFLQMYLEEIYDLPKLTKEQEANAYSRLLSGDETVIQKISDHWLPKVVEMAKEYEKRKVNLEDVIQEGNMGLLHGLNSALGNGGDIDVNGFLKNSIKESMESYIDEMMDDEDWESTVVAKSTLIYEAKKVLQEQLGHVPSVQELADYTKMEIEEITDILSLAKEK